MFGQPMPSEKIEQALTAATCSDLLLALGSTLEVQPAASVPSARRPGVPYAILNQGHTAHDALADLRLDGDVAALLPEAVELAFGREE
jgi:NAD-dependent deacetylase